MTLNLELERIRMWYSNGIAYGMLIHGLWYKVCHMVCYVYHILQSTVWYIVWYRSMVCCMAYCIGIVVWYRGIVSTVL